MVVLCQSMVSATHVGHLAFILNTKRLDHGRFHIDIKTVLLCFNLHAGGFII